MGIHILLCMRILRNGNFDKRGGTMNEILVYTMQDCNDLCGILARNGYCTTAYQLITATSSEILPKQWSIKYYDPKTIEVEK